MHMDVTRILEADHRQVHDLLERLRRSDADGREELVDTLVAALRAHLQLEETVIYPRMSAVVGDEVARASVAEHDRVRAGTDALLTSRSEDNGFAATVDELEELVRVHVTAEEQRVFPELRADRAFLEDVAKELLAARAELGMALDPVGLSSAATRDELAMEAELAGIPHVGKMTKQELAERLVVEMG
jgi:hemerythrin-like domain-containing protein